MASRSRALVCATVAVAVLGGCGEIPTGGPARVVREVPSTGPEPPPPVVDRRLALNIPPDAAPDEIVGAFLHAQGEPAERFAKARRHLAPQATWDAAGRTVVFASRDLAKPVVNGDRATVGVTLRPVGIIATTGEFRPRPQQVKLTFTLRNVPAVGWRIAEAPAGLALSEREVSSAFQRATLYWPDPARRLVPDLFFIRSPDQPVTALVHALLAGPTSWLAPAVRTAIPRGLRVLDPPELVDGVLTLNFSREIKGVPENSLATFVAQVVWTMTERPEVEAVRLLSEGDPIVVPERPALRDHRRADWASFAPVPETIDRRLFFVSNGAASALDDAGRLSVVARTPRLASFAVNRTGTVLAAVTRRSGGRQSLLMVELTGQRRTRTVLTADVLTQPTWEPNGDVVWVARTSGATQQVVAVPAADDPFTVVPVPGTLPSLITSVRLSPDGARAALVVGSGTAASLWLARVERSASGGRTLGEPVRLALSVTGVTAVTFDSPSQLLLAARAGRRPVLYVVDVDGFALVRQRDSGLPAGAVSALAVSAGTPPDRVASVANRLWRRSPAGDWAALRESGVAATFAG